MQQEQRSPPQGGLGSLQINDNTDDAEPQMVQNASAMKVDESKQALNIRMQNSKNNDPDLNNRQKMRISFDPFDPGSNQQSNNASPLERAKAQNQLGNTFESKALRNLDSPRSI